VEPQVPRHREVQGVRAGVWRQVHRQAGVAPQWPEHPLCFQPRRAGVDAEGLRVGTDGPAPRQTEAGEGGHLLQGPGHLGCLQYSAGVRGAAAGQGKGREEEVEHYVWYSAFRLSFTDVNFVRAGKVCYLRGSCLKDTVMRWRYIYWIDTEQLECRNWD